MNKIMQLNKQIDECYHEVEKNYRRYEQNKQRFSFCINNFKNHLPAISTIVILGLLVLTFSTRTRNLVIKLNKNILPSLINARIAISTIATFI